MNTQINTRQAVKSIVFANNPERIDLDSLSVEIWDEYKKILIRDHKSLYEILNCYVVQREGSREDVPMAIKFSCLLSKAFGIEDQDAIKNATLGTCFLDHYTQILDDITDVKVSPNLDMIHASHEMLLEGVTFLTKVGDVGDKIKQYVLEAMESERQLWPANIKNDLFGDVEYSALSKRGGIIRSSAAAYAHLSGEFDIFCTIENCLLKTSQAVQLLDDVSDWQEDYQQNRVTSIINSGHIKDKKYANDELVFDILLEKHAFLKNIDRASALLQEVRSDLSIHGLEEFLTIIDSIAISAKYAREIFEKIAIETKGNRSNLVRDRLDLVVRTNMMH